MSLKPVLVMMPTNPEEGLILMPDELYHATYELSYEAGKRIAAGQPIDDLEEKAQVLMDEYGIKDNVPDPLAYFDCYRCLHDQKIMAEIEEMEKKEKAAEEAMRDDVMSYY